MPLQQLPKQLAPVLIWPVILTTTIGKTMTPAASWSVPQLRRASRSRDCLWRWCYTVKAFEIICLMILFLTCHSCQSKSLKWPNYNKEQQMSGRWFSKQNPRNFLAREFWGNLCNLTVIFCWTPSHDDTWMFAYASTKQILKSRYLFRTPSPSESQLFSYRSRASNHLTSLDTILTSQPTNPFCFNSPTKMKVDGATPKKGGESFW